MEKFQFKVLIIDKEVVSILELIDLLNIFSSINVVGTATNLDDGIDLIKFTHPNIVFLDFEMLDTTGLDIFKEFDSPEFKIILCSSKKLYPIQNSIKSNCGYLLKPVTIIKLDESLQKVHTELLLEDNAKKLEKN